MIFVDTGAWFSTFVPSDQRHRAATEWFYQNTSPLITTDYVVDETLTLLKARGETNRALAVADEFFRGDLATIHFLSAVNDREAHGRYQPDAQAREIKPVPRLRVGLVR